MQTNLAETDWVRLSLFFGVLAVMAVWELLAPRRKLEASRAVRWYANLGLVAVDIAALRLVLPASLLAVAHVAGTNGWGVLHFVNWPPGLEIIIAVAVLDVGIYLQHVMFHAVPLLWRLHRVHHADQDFDVTTGLRFHPLEILLSAGIKAALIVLIGAPALSVLIFEIVLNASSMFNHGNVRIPGPVDRVLRLFAVTPDMHRVHHSAIPDETNSNFGFSVPWWDYLFGTYRAQPGRGHQDMTIGLDVFRRPGDLHLHRLLLQPFFPDSGAYPINRPEPPDG